MRFLVRTAYAAIAFGWLQCQVASAATEIINLTDNRVTFNTNCDAGDIEPHGLRWIACNARDIPIGQSLVPNLGTLTVFMRPRPEFDNDGWIPEAVIVINRQIDTTVFLIKRQDFELTDRSGRIYAREPSNYSLDPNRAPFRGEIESFTIGNKTLRSIAFSVQRKYGFWYNPTQHTLISPQQNPAVITLTSGQSIEMFCFTCGRYFRVDLYPGPSFTIKDGQDARIIPTTSGELTMSLAPPPPAQPVEAAPPPPEPENRCVVAERGYCDLDVLGFVRPGTVCHCGQFNGTVQ